MTEELSDTSPVTDNTDNTNEQRSTMYLKESDIFGIRKPGQQAQWLEHSELYNEIGKIITPSNITGLQRVRGLWRIHVATLEDKIQIMTAGVRIRGKSVSVLNTYPDRPDSELTGRLRIKNVPLTVDDDEVIKRTLTLKGLEIISLYREKLKIDNKLTNCENGDRIVIVTAASLKEPLPKFSDFGKYQAIVIHKGQLKDAKASGNLRPRKVCSKCLLEGHTFSVCPNDYVCSFCGQVGHKAADCQFENPSDTLSETSSKSESTAKSTTDSFDPTETAIEVQETRTSPNPSVSSAGIGRGTPLQRSIGDYLTSKATPNKDKPKNVTDRSPPTPVDQLRQKN